ncbi:unnamed protein product [Prunus armeniaca]
MLTEGMLSLNTMTEDGNIEELMAVFRAGPDNHQFHLGLTVWKKDSLFGHQERKPTSNLENKKKGKEGTENFYSEA